MGNRQGTKKTSYATAAKRRQSARLLAMTSGTARSNATQSQSQLSSFDEPLPYDHERQQLHHQAFPYYPPHSVDDAVSKRRRLAVTPSPVGFYEFEDNLAKCRFDPSERRCLVEGVCDIDAVPSNRLLPIRAYVEDDSTVFVRQYGDEFYRSLMEASHYLTEEERAQECECGLSEEERKMAIHLMAGMTFTRKLSKRTLHLAVQLLTRYFAREDAVFGDWTRPKYLLNAIVSCWLIAHKVEEKELPPLLEDEISIGLLEFNQDTKTLRKHDVLDAEMHIGCVLKFRFHKKIPCDYFDRFLHASLVGDGAQWPHAPNKKLVSLIEYLIDLSLYSKDLVSVHPSLITASAVYLARLTLNITDRYDKTWTDTLAYYTSYSIEDIRDTVKVLSSLQRKANNERKNIFVRKYSRVSIEAAPIPEMLFSC